MQGARAETSADTRAGTGAPITVWRRLGACAEIAAAVVGLFAAAALISAVATPLMPAKFVTPVLGLGMWGAVITGGLLLRRAKSSYAQLGLRRPDKWTKTLAWALGAALASNLGAIGLGLIIQATTAWPPLDVAYIRGSIAGDALSYVVWMGLVVWGSAAFGEELFARGFVLDRLQLVFGRGRLGIVIAVLLQAAMFGALHAIQGPTGIVITAYVGVVFALVYFASGRNLWAPILAHGLMDSVGLTLMFLGLPLPGYSG